MEASIAQRLDEIQFLFRKYGAESAFLFGSAASGTMTEDSDVDFLFSFPSDMDYVVYSDNYFALAHALEALLGRRVDLVTEKTLQNPYLVNSIERNKVQLV